MKQPVPQLLPPEPLAAWAPPEAQQLDMLEHIVSSIDWTTLQPSQLTLALGIADRIRLAAGRRALLLELES